jgi:SAM-dependent methyltransferase
MKLHLGCGTVIRDDWVNVDYALGARLRNVPVLGALVGRLRIFDTDWHPDIVLHDLRKPLPWGDGTAEAIYTSHTLEHLDKDNGERFIRECHRVLRPDGILRICVPNLQGYVEEYRAGRLPARDMMTELNVLGWRDRGVAKELYALLSNSFHRCMYDEASLTALLDQCGLAARTCRPRESDIPDIDRFEHPLDAWTPDRLARNLFVEARKARRPAPQIER